MEGKSRVLKRKELRRRDGGKQVVEREAEGPALHNFQLLSFSLTHTRELSCCLDIMVVQKQQKSIMKRCNSSSSFVSICTCDGVFFIGRM